MLPTPTHRAEYKLIETDPRTIGMESTNSTTIAHPPFSYIKLYAVFIRKSQEYQGDCVL